VRLGPVLRGGVQPVRVVLRTLALLHLHRGASAPEVARLVPLTPQAIHKIAHRYRAVGLAAALYERPRPGAAEVLAPAEKQRIVAMACSAPPPGGPAPQRTSGPSERPSSWHNEASPRRNAPRTRPPLQNPAARGGGPAAPRSDRTPAGIRVPQLRRERVHRAGGAQNREEDEVREEKALQRM